MSFIGRIVSYHYGLDTILCNECVVSHLVLTRALMKLVSPAYCRLKKKKKKLRER